MNKRSKVAIISITSIILISLIAVFIYYLRIGIMFGEAVGEAAEGIIEAKKDWKQNSNTDLQVYYVSKDKISSQNISVTFKNEILDVKRSILSIPSNLLKKDSIVLNFLHNDIVVASLNFSNNHLKKGGEIYFGTIENYIYERNRIDNDDDYDSLLMNNHEEYYTALTSQTYFNQFKDTECDNLAYVYFYLKRAKGVYFGQKFKCDDKILSSIY